MLTKLTRSWQLLLSSLQVVRRHPKLLLFPIVTTACSVVMLLFFLSPTLLYPSHHALTDPAHWQSLAGFFGFDFAQETPVARPNGWFYGYFACLYLASMFGATYCNVAFYHQILEALAGRAVSIRAGLRFAATRLPAILLWSLFAGAIGLLIKAIEERLGWIGRWIARLVGVVWSVASVFAIPVLIRNNTANPITLLRDSAGVLRKTWGESLIGYVGVTVGSWFVLLGSLLFLGVFVAIGLILHAPVIIGLALAVWILALFALSYFTAVAGQVYRGALFIYASEGVVPVPYTAEMMNAAWKVKKA